MKILLLSYGIIDYDGRLHELYDIAKKIGDVTLVCCGAKENFCDESKYVIGIGTQKYLSLSLYLRFILNSFRIAMKIKKIDILFVDNYFAALPALIIKRLCNPKFVVQDVRELYFDNDMRTWKGRALIRSEAKLIKIANLVLCANDSRADIMYRHHKLSTKPVVIENIRLLTGETDTNNWQIKYKSMFSYKVNIVSTGGLSIKRGVDKLILAMENLSRDYGLYIVGSGTEEDIKTVRTLIDEHKLNNVHLIGLVTISELKFIVQKCDIGIVHYHQNDLNNEYCASGKVYEYLFEGLPIVTTENTTLKAFCQRTGVGIADNNFYPAIITITNHLDEYKCRVKDFISHVSVDKYKDTIAVQIRDRLKENENG